MMHDGAISVCLCIITLSSPNAAHRALILEHLRRNPELIKMIPKASVTLSLACLIEDWILLAVSCPLLQNEPALYWWHVKT